MHPAIMAAMAAGGEAQAIQMAMGAAQQLGAQTSRTVRHAASSPAYVASAYGGGVFGSMGQHAASVGGSAASLANPLSVNPLSKLESLTDIGTELATLPATIEAWGTALQESQRHLTRFNGEIASIFSQSEFRGIQRAIKGGEATSGTTGYMVDKLDDLRDTLQPITDDVKNVANVVVGSLADFAEQGITFFQLALSSVFPDLSSFLSETLRKLRGTSPGSSSPAVDFMERDLGETIPRGAGTTHRDRSIPEIVETAAAMYAAKKAVDIGVKIRKFLGLDSGTSSGGGSGSGSGSGSGGGTFRGGGGGGGGYLSPVAFKDVYDLSRPEDRDYDGGSNHSKLSEYARIGIRRRYHERLARFATDSSMGVEEMEALRGPKPPEWESAAERAAAKRAARRARLGVSGPSDVDLARAAAIRERKALASGSELEPADLEAMRSSYAARAKSRADSMVRADAARASGDIGKFYVEKAKRP